MNAAQQAVIAEGVEVVLTDGSTEHFTLTERSDEPCRIAGTSGKAGEQNIPWHTSDEEEHCKFYSNADMAKITATAMEYVTWHVTYFKRFENLYQSIDRNRRSRKGNLWNDYSGRISIRAIEKNDCGSKRMKWVRPLILFGIGGTIYVLIELIARGRSHWTMFFVGD